MFRLPIAILLATLPIAAQTTATSFVQDSPTGFSGNTVPLGCASSGLFAEGRSQILIPAAYLPGPNSLLGGLAAFGMNSSGGNASLHYSSLKITISRTNATSLSATFASNLPLPQVVLDSGNLTVNWVAGTFTPISFTTGYLHDGASNLVIDIQKVVSPAGDATMRTVQNAGRTDLPRMINALGAFGSGAHLAATATVTTNYPLTMQLLWTGFGGTAVPTVRLRSDIGGAASNQFAIGTTVQHTVQGTPGALFVNLQALALLAPPRLLPPVVGRQYVDGVTIGLGTLPGSGIATTSWVVPANPALVGLYTAFQSLVAPAPFTQLAFTNVADCFVRS